MRPAHISEHPDQPANRLFLPPGVLVALTLFGLSALNIPAQQGDVFTDASTIRALTPAALAATPKAELNGLVISVMPDGKHFCLYGKTNLMIFDASSTNRVAVGDLVKINGQCVADPDHHVIADEIEVTGVQSRIPVPAIDGDRRLGDPKAALQWMETTGSIVSMRKSEVGWHFEMNRHGRRFEAVVPRRGRPVTREFRHALVQIRGVSVPLNQLGIRSSQLVIWIDNWYRIQLLEPPAIVANLPVRTISEFTLAEADELESRRLRIRGEIVRTESSGKLFVRDKTGEIEVEPERVGIVRVGDQLDVIGFAERRGEKVLVTDAEVRVFAAPNPTQTPAGKPRLVEYLGKVGQIKRLNPGQIAAGPPARINGTVTFVDTNKSGIYVQDSTGSIRVEGGFNRHFVAGDQIVATGHAIAGNFGPKLKAEAVDWLAQADRPMPAPATSTGLLAGQYEAELITLNGVVRRDYADDRFRWLKVVRSDRQFELRFPRDTRLPEPLIGAKIQFAGVVQARVNQGGQIVGIKILMAGAKDVEVTTPAPADRFAIEVSPIGGLMGYQTRNPYTRPKRIEGVVTLAWPDRLFVQDDSDCIEVLPATPGEAQAGLRVSVVGFPKFGELKPTLVDAVLRPGEKTTRPEPISAVARDIFTAGINGERVTLEATVNAVTGNARVHSMVVQSGGIVLNALLPTVQKGELLLGIKPGSLVRVTGICHVHAGPDGRPGSVDILLDDAADVEVLRAPSWWTPTRAWTVMAFGAIMLLGSLGWVKRLRMSVSETRQQLAKSLDVSPVAIGVMSADGSRLLEANRSFLRQFGFQHEDIEKRSIHELGIWPSREERSKVLRLCRERGSVRGLETEMRSGSGNSLHVLLSGETIEWQGSAAVLLAAQDVTERFELVNQLRESQKMEAVGRLAAGVAHDFNNILTIIQGNSDMISDAAADHPEVEELNTELNEAAERAAKLTRQLLAFSRKQLMRPQALDLNDVIRDSVRLLRRLLGAPIKVVTKLSAQDVRVEADHGMLEQVLMNLAVNARDAMPSGGELHVTTRVVNFATKGNPRQFAHGPGPWALLRVTDDGTGMPPEVLEQMFEPFFTTKDVGQGTGLGLATVYGIVKQHQGWIEGESEIDRGTAFNIFLPLAGDVEIEESEDEEDAPELAGSETIFVVEDESQLRRMVERTLIKHGYTVHSAKDGVDAKRKWPQYEDDVDLLITDIVMPQGISGWQLAEEFKERNGELKVIYTTGFSPEFERKGKQLEKGRNFLPKPFTQHDLAVTLRNALDQPGNGD